MIKCKNVILVLAVICFWSTASVYAQSFQVGRNGMVVSASSIASQVGVDVLRRGGNAVDAAVAVGFALAVVFPEAGNIGGGGFMLIRTPTGAITALDYRETAPGKATPQMYLAPDGSVIPNLSTEGALAVGVPGAVRGYEAAWRKFGKLPWKKLVSPAADLARNGFPVTYYVHQGIAANQPLMQRFPASQAMFFPDGKVPEIGQLIRFPALARTLRLIAQKGAGEFYEGATARQLVQALTQAGGIITLEDLKQYKVVERAPILFNYRGYQIASMPPPSSGGICLGQILQMLEPFSLSEYGFQSSTVIQIMVEAERRAYANRAYYLGDPDFVKIPLKQLLDPSINVSVTSSFNLDQATPSAAVSHFVFPESEETTHFSVIDKDGMAVASTTTLNGSYGSGFVAEGTGILLNNEMDDFAIKPGVPNMYGLLGAEANAIAPNKRMLSSMTPTFVMHNDSLCWILGTPGGGTIITTIAQVIVNLIDFRMTLPKAVDAPRFHHQWLPDEVYYERNAFSPDLLNILESKGYHLTPRSAIGDVNAIAVDRQNGYYLGMPDKRRQSAAAGY